MALKRKAIVAIDPGPTKSAWVVWDGQEIRSCGMDENEEVNERIMRDTDWNGIIPLLAVEMIESFGMPVGREVFQTCVWIGRFVERWGDEFTLPGRRLVKVHLCGNNRAKDSNVRQALVDRFGKPGTKKAPGITYGLTGDLWQAFGLAVTVWDGLCQVRL